MEIKTPSVANADSQKQKEIQPYVYEAEVYKDSPRLRRHLEEEMAKQEVLRTKFLHAEEITMRTKYLLNLLQQPGHKIVSND